MVICTFLNFKFTSRTLRDMNTFDFAKHFTNKMIAKNADPVIVWEFKDNLDNVVIPKCPKRMCLIYSYRNRINDKSEIENILTFCKEKNLTPVALGAPQYWINKYIACDPFQCLLIAAFNIVFLLFFKSLICGCQVRNKNFCKKALQGFQSVLKPI